MQDSARACRIFFFFQAEDGIRDVAVTGVQTCALPISLRGLTRAVERFGRGDLSARVNSRRRDEIGRASCGKSVDLGGRRIIKKKKRIIKVESRSKILKDCRWYPVRREH